MFRIECYDMLNRNTPTFVKALISWATWSRSFGMNLAPQFSITKKPQLALRLIYLWAHLGSNQAPTDYESVALTE